MPLNHVALTVGDRNRSAAFYGRHFGLEPLWRSLQAHHRALAPTLAGLPARSPEESSALRRRRYSSALEDPGSFLLTAGRAASSAMRS